SRLGIPLTIASDPRHGFANNPGAAMTAGAFSAWPEPVGFGAIGDERVVERFADIARREYRAVGIHLALHPMADLATEPRWSRNHGTFGEDPALAGRLTAAYIRGFQGETLGPESVACMTKHFPGGGPQLDGEDPHFPYGREQVYPGGNFAAHLIPFEAAFAAGTAQIMPYYGIPVGLDLEEVGFAFNKQVITGMLRERYGFDGVICTDWGVLNDSLIFGKTLPARAWGVESLSVADRALKALEAGVDQFGGESCPRVIVELVRAGRVPEERLDLSVRRLLRDKFRLGLFDNPFVDPDAAEALAGNAEFRAAGERAQRASICLLTNENGRLPLAPGLRLYVENVDPAVASRYGSVVPSPGEADLAVLRLAAPFETRDRYPLEDFFHSGSLAFAADALSRILAVMRQVPTVVDIYLERAAVIPEIAAASSALLGSFGASDEALFDLLFGRFSPTGKLPIELPSSMAAVQAQKPDLPFDSANPLYPIGHGLTY
ncbi:MAG: glycoside hydrolase family 3 C-terminal domain-containing protein, partial [Thermomicrobiales bacterium]|nr:glycoside hydrolase family 3 C-terminal domain-containing protein [Thermomicrobiales bacterium]